MGVDFLVGCTKIEEQAAIQAAAAAGLRSVDQLIVQLSHHTDTPIDCREITDYTVAKFKKMISILDRTGHARFRRGPAAPPPPQLFSAKPSSVARGGAIPTMPPAPRRCHCPKRRKNVAKRTIRVPAASWRTAALPHDEYTWRKYGQKPIKGSPHPRGYYKCTSERGCPARKHVERERDNPMMLIVTYEGDHRHANNPSVSNPRPQGI